MPWYAWTGIGLVVSVVVWCAYLLISPYYRKGETFSLPLLFIGLSLILHCLFAVSVLRWFCLATDLFIISSALFARLRWIAGNGKDRGVRESSDVEQEE